MSPFDFGGYDLVKAGASLLEIGFALVHFTLTLGILVLLAITLRKR